MAFQPTSWGNGHTSKDYEFMMQGANVISKPVSLLGHALTDPNQNLSDPVTKRIVKKIRGKIVEREIVIRPAEQLSLTFTINFSDSLETPALVRARRGGSTKTTFYAVRLCAEDKLGHAYIFPDGLMNQPSRVNSVISIDDTTLADWQTELRVDEELVLYEVFGYVAQGVDTEPLYAIAFFSEDCSVNQNQSLYTDMIAVGGQGTTNPIAILLSSNRFATTTTPSSAPAPNGSIGTCIWTQGDVVIVGFADVASGGTGTTGGTLFSVDAGDNFSLDVDISEPIFGVIEFGGQYLVVGGTTAGGAYMALSEDGLNWTEVTDSDIPAGAHFTDVSYDADEGNAYVTAANGTLFRVEPAGDTVNVIPLTGFSGSPASLDSVDVKGADHVAIAGPSGYYAETLDAGANWLSKTVPTTGTIVGNAGNAHRSMTAAGTQIFRRDVLSDFEYTALTLNSGASITGNITAIAELPNLEISSDDLNYFAFCTDQEEVFVVKSDSPFA